MDFVMPVMDGPTATQEARRLGFRGYVVGLTGQLQVEEVAIFLKSGADHVLGKPLDMDRLLAILAALP